MTQLQEKIAKHLGKTVISIVHEPHRLQVITMEDTVPLVFLKSVLYKEIGCSRKSL